MPHPLQSSEELESHIVAAGCPQVTVHSDGHQFVLDGLAPTYECKVLAEEVVRGLTGLPVLNRIRVVPVES